MLWSQLTQQGMTFQAQNKAHNGLQPRMRHEPLGPLFMCRSRDQLYITATISSMVLSRRVDHPVICMVKIEFLLRFNGQQLVFWNYMGGWRLCSKDRIDTNWQIEPTFKYLQEQELPKQSRSNSGQFQMSRLVHRNHSARKTHTNRKLVLRQSSAVHSTLQLQDSCSSEQEKTKNHTVQGFKGLGVSPSHRWLDRNLWNHAFEWLTVETWWHISTPVAREVETNPQMWIGGQLKWTHLNHSNAFKAWNPWNRRHRFFIGNYLKFQDMHLLPPFMEGISPRLHE